METPQTLYIDCNRDNAQIKSDELKNEWVNVLSEPLKLNAGSEITIQNSFVNYKGLSGGSVELLDNYNITMKYVPYLSHTDFNSIKAVNANVSSFYNDADPLLFQTSQTSNLVSIVYSNFEAIGYQYLMTEGLNTKMDQTLNVDGYPPDPAQPFDLFVATSQNIFGFTEQPLFPVSISPAGYLTPKIEDAFLTIPKGIYGINELSDLIQDQLNGVRNFTTSIKNKDASFTQQQVDYFNGTYKWNTSQFTSIYEQWDKSVGTFNDIASILLNTPLSQLVELTKTKPLFITASQFNRLIYNWKRGNKEEPEFQYITFTNTNFIFVIKNNVNNGAGPPENPSGRRIFDESRNPVLTGGQTDDQKVFNTIPYGNGYYLGTSSFLFTYDTEKSGFSIQYLHEPRRQPSHDIIGNKNEQEGQIVSYLKQIVAPDLFDNFGITTEEQTQIISTLHNPRSRISGVCIINWDQEVCIAESGKTETTDPNQDYYSWIDFFENDRKKAEQAWSKTLWFKLGFTYLQLQDDGAFEKVKSFDLDQVSLPGFTTNNSVDISITNTMSNDYIPLESNTASDFNATLPFVIKDQVKQYNNALPARNYFAFNNNTYQNFENFYYYACQTYPVLTQSISTVAKFLPDLSEQGYFLITSDIVDGFKDTVKKGDPLSLLGVVPKSSLSNQDFISSFQEIVQTTTQDKIINSIKIKILNPDLTNPVLNSRSSVILKIVNNVPAKSDKKKN